ncbi:hypothetical protein BGZ61DRAFT_485649 [Ilyonectria robusta]|uniref:uncharacterized protein n=1 Tax=Ilyonectria robusta TaxID=1079257 RepID=UPI001E8DF44E|nr:uncharacterized protein BGZ61DRAFT_485649 [Ilyonectria robusta]KAH8659663.1 hypothetical protein BGZ61DRAFT_485649 [Ilyonectria robusta]
MSREKRKKARTRLPQHGHLTGAPSWESNEAIQSIVHCVVVDENGFECGRLLDPQLGNDSSSTKRVEVAAEADSPTVCESGSAAIDTDDDVWEVEAVLAKWKQGRQAQYLVKWKGFEDTDNSWVNQGDISKDLVERFELGQKRTRRRKVRRTKKRQ